MKKLKAESLEAIKSRSSEPVVLKIFEYLEANKISLENLIAELKEDFLRKS